MSRDRIRKEINSYTDNTNRTGRAFRVACVIFVTLMIVFGIIITIREYGASRFGEQDMRYSELKFERGWSAYTADCEDPRLQKANVTIPYVGEKLVSISMRNKLPDQIGAEWYLYPHTNYQAIEVYVAGEKQDVFGIREDGETFSDLPWTAVRITEDMAGKEIEIRLLGYGDREESILYDVLLGRQSDIKWYLVRYALNRSFSSVIFGLVMVIIMLVIAIVNSRYKSGQAADFLYLAEYIILNLIWIFTDSTLQGAFFIGNRAFYYLNVYSFILQMIPLFLFLHANSQRAFTRMVCTIGNTLLIILTIGSFLSMNAGRFKLYRMLKDTHLAMFGSIVLMVILLLYERIRYKNKSLRLLLIGIGVAIIFGALSLSNFYTHVSSDNTLGIRQGTLVLVSILCVNGIMKTFQLLTSGRAFMDIAEKVPLGICRMIIGKEEIEYANANYYQMLGIRNEENGKKLVHRKRDVIHPEDYRRYVDTIKNHVLNKEYHYEIEVRYVCSDDRVIWALENHEVDLHAKRITTTLYDITQRIKMEKQLRDREEETRIAAGYKAEFLANMSHEIRTPMNVICGMAELLENCDLSPLENEYVGMIKSSSNNLLGIVNDILDFSKIDSGKLELVEQNYSIRDLLYDIQTVTAPKISTKMLRYLIYVDPTMPSTLLGDSGRIRQILINLINNATKFTQKGEISLTVRCKRIGDNKVRITFGVRDTGIGIKDEDLDKLFTQFTRLDTKKNRSVEGTGLGLALSRELARRMNGDITVDSVYGEGSIFTARIEQVIVDDNDICLKENGDAYAVLVLEEDAIRRRAVMDALKDYGIATVYTEPDPFMKAEAAYKVVLYDYSTYSMYVDMQEEWDDVFRIAMVEYGNKDIEEESNVSYLQKPVSLVSLRNFLTEDGPRQKQMLRNNMIFHVHDVSAVVVDDNHLNLRVADGLMRRYGLQPELLSSGIELLERMKQGVHYDIIFLDHMMPELDGIETVGKIRKSSDVQWRNVPVIALTANAIKGMEAVFLNAGMTDYLFKPIEKKSLEDILVTYLADKCVYEEADGENTQMSAGERTSIPQIPGIAVAQAVKLVGDNLETYYEVVTEYLEKIDENTAALMDYLEGQDIKKYTILIHALKSTTRLVGNLELAECALRLETAGHEENWDAIVAGTEAFVTEYQRMREIFVPYLPERYQKQLEEYTAVGGAVTDDGEVQWTDEWKRILALVKEQLENYEDEEAMEILRPLMNDCKNAAATEVLRKIAMLIKAVEYDEAIGVIDDILL